MYGRNAKKLIEALRADFPEFTYFINENKPKRNSFEITLTKEEECNFKHIKLFN